MASAVEAEEDEAEDVVATVEADQVMVPTVQRLKGYIITIGECISHLNLILKFL